MIFNEQGEHTLLYKATDECGNQTVEERLIIAENPTYNTVLFNDGTLIINEDHNDREQNIADHGDIVQEYEVAPYSFSVQADIPWYAQRNDVRRVEFGSAVTQTNCARLFNELMYCVSIDLTNLDTTGCTNFSRMFSSCNRLEEIIGLDGLDTSAGTTMEMMFYNCYALPRLNLASFDTGVVYHMGQMFRNCGDLVVVAVSPLFVTSQVTQSNNMFTGCASIVGRAGTTYNSSYTNKTYARIDNPPSAPGYFSVSL